jgi:hypothetical protein
VVLRGTAGSWHLPGGCADLGSTQVTHTHCMQPQNHPGLLQDQQSCRPRHPWQPAASWGAAPGLLLKGIHTVPSRR